ncbi:uncharacterized protein LOC143357661 [Halictus rubicundus]|uniref:uncharacterized protein LOC143357661 n=1 Tax=Halictus rubicundus TaxID=77578 RepID=UPI004035A6AE
MMEGEGVYRWSNGIQYKGEFQQNQMHGIGLLQLHNNCWYKGDFENGYQHGKGLFVDSDNRFMYTGQWCKGHKHGKGYSRYQDNSSYDGDWIMDKMCGFGLRIYPSGARYIGQWKNGLRHGTGTMVWTNGDVYRGEWRCGSMNGYGVYVWNSFFNKTFTWPQETSYVGYWRNGMRHGEGQVKLNTIGSAKYSGYWKNDKKHGPGTIIGNNGEKLEADPLFLNDILVSSDIKNNINPDQSATDDVDQSMLTAKESTSSFVEKPSKLKVTPIIPVLKPEQFPSLSYYLIRLFDPESLEGPLIRSVPSGKCYICDNRSCSCLTSSTIDISKSEEKIDTTMEVEDAMKSEREYEQQWAYNCLTMHMSRLREIYANFAKLFSISAPECNLVMSRMCLWQFWRDCKIHEKGLSLIQINNHIAKNGLTIVEDPHDPFETIEIWQFLHALLEVSWHLYGKWDNAETQGINGKLAGSLHKFLENDVYPHIKNHVGSLCREYSNLLPMSSVFKLNQSIGHPCLAKDFLRATCTPKADGLLVFRELGATKMLEIIALVCPGIKDPDNGFIINMDYEF